MAVSLPLMRLFVVHVRYVLQVLSHGRMIQGRGSAVRVPVGGTHLPVTVSHAVPPSHSAVADTLASSTAL